MGQVLRLPTMYMNMKRGILVRRWPPDVGASVDRASPIKRSMNYSHTEQQEAIVHNNEQPQVITKLRDCPGCDAVSLTGRIDNHDCRTFSSRYQGEQ